MKKFKLNSVLASVLSLGVVCSGSVFATEERASTPKLPEEPVTTALTRQKSRANLLVEVPAFEEIVEEKELSRIVTPVLEDEEEKECPIKRENARIFDMPRTRTPVLEDEEEESMLKKTKSVDLKTYELFGKQIENIESLLEKIKDIKTDKNFPKTINELVNVISKGKLEDLMEDLNSECLRLREEKEMRDSWALYNLGLMIEEAVR